MTRPVGDPLLTLEPLIEAVREGVESRGWELSGLQKTTSHQFEGRWEGESTRSAYLFFHAPNGPDFVSVDAYLDETSQGLTGNIALVVDLVALNGLGNIPDVLHLFGQLSGDALPKSSRTPITLRLRLDDASADPGEAEGEARFKLRFPSKTIALGASAMRDLCADAVCAFEQILGNADLRRLASPE